MKFHVFVNALQFLLAFNGKTEHFKYSFSNVEQRSIWFISAHRFEAHRIVGGHEVNIETYPWQASILNGDGHFCGGAIIDKYRILTAAHCVQGFIIVDYDMFIRVRVGSSNRTSGGMLCKVKKVILHEEYQKPTLFDNDIAILVLKLRLQYSPAIQPVSLPPLDADLPDNSTVFVSGWGYTNREDEKDIPIILNAVSVPIVDRDVCHKTYKNLTIAEELNVRVTNNMICAGLFGVGGKDSCQV